MTALLNLREQRPLASGRLVVPVFGLGTAQAGGLFQAMSDATARELFDSAWAQGIRFFDTAPYYGYTRSERRVGTALSSRPRSEFVLSTKAGRLMRPDNTVKPGDDNWADPLPFRPVYDYSYDGLTRSLDDSLQRLGLARIDILYVHDIGRMTHGDRHDVYWQQLTQGGGFRALGELRAAGLVSAVGLGVNEWQVAHQSLQEFDLDCVMLAGRYTLLEQGALSPFLDDCERLGTSVVAAAPFNSGVLAGGTTYDYGNVPAQVVARVEALRVVCREFGVALPAAALQFPLAHPAVVSCVAGAPNANALSENIALLEQPIPDSFWLALRERGLVHERAPLPAERTNVQRVPDADTVPWQIQVGDTPGDGVTKSGRRP